MVDQVMSLMRRRARSAIVSSGSGVEELLTEDSDL